MRSAQMCRIMLAVSLTFTLFQPLRAVAQGSPPPTYTLPPKAHFFVCAFPGPCELQCHGSEGLFACTDKGPLENYTKDRQDEIGKKQEELFLFEEDEKVQRKKIKEAQQDIDSATNLPALRAAQKAQILAKKKLEDDQSSIEILPKEIKALQDELNQTVSSHKQTVDSNAGKCTCYVEDERTHECTCTKERYERAVREGNNARVCGGGQSR